MRITTTDGQEHDIPDMCAYCEMNSGGEHKPDCPLYKTHSTLTERGMTNIEANIFINGVKLGLEDIKAGRVVPLSEIEKKQHSD